VQILAQWTNTYGSVFKWNIAGQDMLVITDPEEVSKLCSRDLNLPKSAPFYKGLNHVRPRHEHVFCAQEQLTDTHILCTVCATLVLCSKFCMFWLRHFAAL
jgi:hypothetical protein